MPTVSNLFTNHPTISHHILVVGISAQRIGFDPKPVYVAIVVDSVVLLQDFLYFRYLRFSSGSIIHQCYILLFHSSTADAINRVFK